MKKTNLGLFGSSGKMGLAVEEFFLKEKKTKFTPYLAVGKTTSRVFAMTLDNLENIETQILDDVDVWIDFSSVGGLFALIKKTEKLKTPIVSGSTGFTTTEFLNLKAASKKRPLFWASNLSPGLWAFRQALQGLGALSHFDFAVDEIHHNQKKDKPSGTAKTLHADVEKITGKTIPEPNSHRLGGVFGIHNVIASSANETLTFQHQALNRGVFAEGALGAADWLIGKSAGLYSMDDLYLNKKKEK